jgi:hypothetical protein
MKFSTPKALALCLVLNAPQIFAANNNGGFIGQILCKMLCVANNPCTITDPHDPTAIPLKNPFCHEQQQACFARCNTLGGGLTSNGLLQLHDVQPSFLACQ